MADIGNFKYDPFLQRAIEHWLDSVNELTYQSLFCEHLIMTGHSLKYSIRNTNFEHGKDIVSVDNNNIPYAFQLKGGKITLNRWRSEVKPEIEAMMETSIEHPEIDKNVPHVSYLVTNGEIEDSARVEITMLNEKKWKNNPLKVWTRGDLLHFFLEMANGFFPKDAKWYKELTDLMFVNGTGLPDIERIEMFLANILQIETSEVTKEQRKRDIAIAIIYSNIISGPYKEKVNYTSSVQIMTALTSLILCLVDTYQLEDKYWLESVEIVWNDITQTSELLEKEISDGAFESDNFGYADQQILSYRKQATASIVFSLNTARFIQEKKEWVEFLTDQSMKRYKGALSIWGESSFLPHILMMCILKNFIDTKHQAIGTARWIIRAILDRNGRKGKNEVGLLSPYYGIDEVVDLLVINTDEEIEDNFQLKSYYLKPLIEFLVRMEDRELISDNWKEISFLHFIEFIPDNKTDFYRYRIKNGENRMIAPQPMQKWSELLKEAQVIKEDTLPNSIQRFPFMLPFFLTIYPHRFNSATMSLLFNNCVIYLDQGSKAI